MLRKTKSLFTSYSYMHSVCCAPEYVLHLFQYICWYYGIISCRKLVYGLQVPMMAHGQHSTQTSQVYTHLNHDQSLCSNFCEKYFTSCNYLTLAIKTFYGTQKQSTHLNDSQEHPQLTFTVLEFN